MTDSILTSVKKILGVAESYTVFDADIVMHINSVLATLNQLGIGPRGGFFIEDASPTWTDLLAGDPRVNNVKSYVCLRVRMLFDPPTTSYLLSAMEKQITEQEWRLNVQREDDEWVPPIPLKEPPYFERWGVEIDGGGP